MELYKHFTTITSQLYFCSSPLRIDTYNRCQFGCVYCFSRNRRGDNTLKGIKQASPNAFLERMKRVSAGKIQSALDEFLSRRVPIQLGGMFDPFTPLEAKQRKTLHLLEILNDYQYPTLISTKGDIFLRDEYSRILEKMNVLVRISSAGVAEKFRDSVDIGCASFNGVLSKIKEVRSLGLNVSLRIQPVIPGFESDALEMTERAAKHGAQHVSFEYLKVTSESRDAELRKLNRSTGLNIWKLMLDMGLTKTGRDYTLNTNSKLEFLARAKKLCQSLDIKFGAGDTEFIHMSDGNGCCNGSSQFLKDSNQFNANFVGLIKNNNNGIIRFSGLDNEWMPRLNIHQYLTTNSRSRSKDDSYSSLKALLAYRWNGGKGPYSPAFFSGVTWTGEYDDQNFKIYRFLKPF